MRGLLVTRKRSRSRCLSSLVRLPEKRRGEKEGRRSRACAGANLNQRGWIEMIVVSILELLLPPFRRGSPGGVVDVGCWWQGAPQLCTSGLSVSATATCGPLALTALLSKKAHEATSTTLSRAGLSCPPSASTPRLKVLHQAHIAIVPSQRRWAPLFSLTSLSCLEISSAACNSALVMACLSEKRRSTKGTGVWRRCTPSLHLHHHHAAASHYCR